jgi:hypothetical protein
LGEELHLQYATHIIVVGRRRKCKRLRPKAAIALE